MAVAQVVSPGPNRRKVMVPVGADPPVRVAESETLPPAGTEAEGVVAMVGLALTTPVQVSDAVACSVVPPMVTLALMVSDRCRCRWCQGR